MPKLFRLVRTASRKGELRCPNIFVHCARKNQRFIFPIPHSEHEANMLLAFGHKARQGKDTAGEAVVEYYNRRRESAAQHLMRDSKFDALYPPASIFKFADALYQVCREEYGMTEKDAPLLQKVGDGRREQFGKTYWIDKLSAKIDAFKGIAVITDVRYTNEADWVNARGGHCINVRRLHPDGTPFVTTDRDPNFISEVQLDPYNYEFYIMSKYAAYTADAAITIAEFIRGWEL